MNLIDFDAADVHKNNFISIAAVIAASKYKI